jgi:xylan 1,4-beta-xylosidase
MRTGWNVEGMMASRDTIFVGPALAKTVRLCDGLTEMLCFWTFSDVFEKSSPIAEPFESEFGLRAKGGIDKPGYSSFGLLHRLGKERFCSASKDSNRDEVGKGRSRDCRLEPG